MYKDKHSGARLQNIPSFDFSIFAAMLAVVIVAWGISKMESTFMRHEKFVPEYTVSSGISVSPIIEPVTRKEAEKVGKFMSLAKSGSRILANADAIEQANEAVLDKMVLAKGMPYGGSMTAPKIIYKTMPDYPVKAVEAGYSGTVVVKMYILKNGRVGSAMIEKSSGYEILDSSALSAVSLWVFEPAVYQKDSTEVWFRVPIKFALKS